MWSIKKRKLVGALVINPEQIFELMASPSFKPGCQWTGPVPDNFVGILLIEDDLYCYVIESDSGATAN